MKTETDTQTELEVGGIGAIKPHTSARNIWVTFAISLGSFLYGYTTNVITGAFAMTSFNALFLYRDTDSRIGAALGVFLAGGVFGAILQQPICDRYGRRAGIGTGAIFLIVGGALASGSINIAMLLVSRFIGGVGSAIGFTVAPMLISELAPPHSRGLMVSLHVVCLNSGYLISSICSLGFSYLTAVYQWRLNFIINTVVSVCLLLLVIFAIPESPRWLIAQGRVDDARDVLNMLHASKQDPEGLLARAELYQIHAQLEADKKLPKGYIHIFRTPSLRKRALCTILVWFISMATGVLVIANLTPLLFAGLNYGSTAQFGLSVAWLVVCIISAFLGGLLVDRYGRRLFLAIGGIGCAVTLALEAAMQAEYLGTTNKAGLNAAVAFFFLFAVAYNMFYDAGSFVYTAEIWPSHLRGEGVTIAMVTFYLFAIAYNVPASEALTQIGWKFYLVFIVITTVATVVMWFYVPETAGLTLEEIGERFGETAQVHFNEIDVKAMESSTESAPMEVRVEKMS